MTRDLTTGSPMRLIWSFALPTLFGMLFQQFYNMMDTMIVGQLLGAGVIISSSLSLYYAPVMLVLGLVMGALTSVTLRALLPALGKMGFNTHENRPE